MERTENESNSTVRTYLTFSMNNEVFALEVFKVINILEMCPVTKVPQAPSYMKGVINLRGNVIPLIDLRLRFGLPEPENNPDTCIIVVNLLLEGENVNLGLVVDAAKEVVDIPEDKIEPFPSIGSKYNSYFMQGMYRDNNNLILLLDVEKLFINDEMSVLTDLNKIS